MLYEFLQQNQEEILNLTAKKTLELAGKRSSSTQLEAGLPIFFEQLLDVLLLESEEHKIYEDESEKVRLKNKTQMVKAASESDETSLAESSGRPDEAELAKTAKAHGEELLRLGYTLSHVVHAYGAICQAITELATVKKIEITANEFHDFNRCLDIAIAGAVTGFTLDRDTQEANREVRRGATPEYALPRIFSELKLRVEIIGE